MEADVDVWTLSVNTTLHKSSPSPVYAQPTNHGNVQRTCWPSHSSHLEVRFLRRPKVSGPKRPRFLAFSPTRRLHCRWSMRNPVILLIRWLSNMVGIFLKQWVDCSIQSKSKPHSLESNFNRSTYQTVPGHNSSIPTNQKWRRKASWTDASPFPTQLHTSFRIHNTCCTFRNAKSWFSVEQAHFRSFAGCPKWPFEGAWPS